MCLRTDIISSLNPLIARLNKWILSILPHGSHFLYLWKWHGSTVVSLLVLLQVRCPKMDVVLQLRSYQCWFEQSLASCIFYRAVYTPQCEVCLFYNSMTALACSVYDATLPLDAFLRGVLLTLPSSPVQLMSLKNNTLHPSIFNNILFFSDHFCGFYHFLFWCLSYDVT